MSTWPWTRHAFPCSDIAIMLLLLFVICVFVYADKWKNFSFFHSSHHWLENCILLVGHALRTTCLWRRQHLHEIILRIWGNLSNAFSFSKISKTCNYNRNQTKVHNSPPLLLCMSHLYWMKVIIRLWVLTMSSVIFLTTCQQ